MKITLEKGQQTQMETAMDPYISRLTRDHANVPDRYRRWHLRIIGGGDECMTLHATREELVEVAKMLNKALETIDRKERRTYGPGTVPTHAGEWRP